MPINYVFRWTVEGWLKCILVYLAYIAAPIITGQIISYKQGDDAWWDQDIPYPLGFSRYISVGENIIFDHFTGLEWIADPSAIGGIWGTLGTPATMSWTEAIAACNALSYGGHNDWRMPNSNELDTLIDYGEDHPTISKNRFPNTQSEGYWTSSMTNYGCLNMWFTYFDNGQKAWEQDKNKQKYIRPVRGQSVPEWMGGIKGQR
jgi:hypothetical protein